MILRRDVDRRTQDLDIFGLSAGDVQRLLPAAEAALQESGFEVRRVREGPGFVRLVVERDGDTERFQLQIRPGELLRLLVDFDPVAAPPVITVEEFTDALESLVGWGNVNPFYDPAAPETLDEFYAKRFLYQLTEAGVAAHEGIRAVRRVGLDSGRLSGVLLPASSRG